jgi:hypothetical protein
LVPNLADKAAVAPVRSIRADIDNAVGRGDATAGETAHNRVAPGGVVQERLITVGRVADPLSWFSESGFIGVYPWP